MGLLSKDLKLQSKGSSTSAKEGTSFLVDKTELEKQYTGMIEKLKGKNIFLDGDEKDEKKKPFKKYKVVKAKLDGKKSVRIFVA